MRRPQPAGLGHGGPAGPGTYGDSFADVYDEWYGDITDAAATAAFVAARAGRGPVLELGVGTGRLAQPLAAAGLAVVGLDASAAMLAGWVGRQPGRPTEPGRGDSEGRIAVVQADMAALPFTADCGFGAVLIAFNTLFNLPTAEAQRSLFAALAPRLGVGGVIVVEAMDTEALTHGPHRSVALSRHHPDGVTVVGTRLDPAEQTIVGHHLDIRAGGLRGRPWFLRWSSTDEIDAFAADAGLTLSERHRSWRSHSPDGPSELADDVDVDTEPGGGEGHISVYRRPTPAGTGADLP